MRTEPSERSNAFRDDLVALAEEVVREEGAEARIEPAPQGDVVSLCDPDGVEFARGLSNYSSADLDRLRGLRTEQIREDRKSVV